METLMREMSLGGEGSGSAALSEEDREKAKALAAAWEAMLVEGMDEAVGTRKDEDAEGTKGEKEKAMEQEVEDSFQKSIRQAMEKLESSESAMQSEAGAGGDESLDALLKQLSGALGEGEGEDGDMQGLLESMMSQLMSKEVLYEPLKELNDKFPSYLSDNASSLSPDDKSRYEAQYHCVTKIVQIFEDPSYSEEDTEKGKQVVELMNEMQSHGSPPSEIMGPLPPGFDLGADGLPKVPDGCVIS
ncbi:Pex19 protein [Heliocybe sulcata]|uniref:Pex19 protein n=1 Tax=Heliocybe sulcata TaxID=5364 RepID=A0A5C3N0P1_9AGAM|nr:Pex19 protein [Heliocybe sulcata]